MSITVARRPHRHVPWLPMVVMLAVVAAAVLIALLTVGQPQTTPATSGTRVVAAGTAAQPSAAAAPAPATRKYARAPGAAGAPSPLAFPAPPLRKSARTPWVTGGGSPDR